MPERWSLHTVVFDLDDTLYAERDFVLSGFAAVDAWLRANHGIDGFAAVAQQLFESGRRGDIFDAALLNLRVPEVATLVPRLVEIYRAHAPTLSLLPDARDALEWIAGAGLNVALVTDGYAAVQRGKLRALGLDARIPCCIVTDELGGREFWKPHEGAFHRVMQLHPGPVHGYAYVADNPRKDFIAPLRLGWRTVRVRRPRSEHAAFAGEPGTAAEREVASLAELRWIFAARPATAG